MHETTFLTQFFAYLKWFFFALGGTFLAAQNGWLSCEISAASDGIEPETSLLRGNQVHHYTTITVAWHLLTSDVVALSGVATNGLELTKLL